MNYTNSTGWDDDWWQLWVGTMRPALFMGAGFSAGGSLILILVYAAFYEGLKRYRPLKHLVFRAVHIILIWAGS